MTFTRTDKEKYGGWEFARYFRLYFRNEEEVPLFNNSVPYLYEGQNFELPPCDAIHVKVKENVTAIKGNAFSGWKKLVSVDMANSQVTEIGYNAFKGCKSLKIVRFPKNDTLKKIRDKAFWECKSIEVLLIPPQSNILEIVHFTIAVI